MIVTDGRAAIITSILFLITVAIQIATLISGIS